VCAKQKEDDATKNLQENVKQSGPIERFSQAIQGAGESGINARQARLQRFSAGRWTHATAAHPYDALVNVSCQVSPTNDCGCCAGCMPHDAAQCHSHHI